MNTAIQGKYVLLANLRYTVFREMATGLRSFLNEKGLYMIRVVNLEDSRELHEVLPGALGVFGTFYYEKELSWLQQSGLPLVNMANSVHKELLHSVTSDDLAVGRMAARHFLQRGFRKFLYLRNGDSPYSVEREIGWKAGLEEAGLTSESFDIQQVQAAIEEVHASSLPVGIFGANDWVARNVLELLLQAGVAVPAKASILGVDNDRLENNLSPLPLASIRLPGFQIGYLAGQLMEQFQQDPAQYAKGTKRLIRVPPVEVVKRRSADALAVRDARTAQLLRLIHQDPARFKSVDDIVRAARIPRRTAEESFRKHTGRSIFEEWSTARFDRINAFLLNSDLPLSAIADRCGFSDAHALCIAFKRKFQTTPGTHRKKARSLQFSST